MDEGYCNPGTLQFMSPQCIKSLPYSNKVNQFTIIIYISLMLHYLQFRSLSIV